MPSLLTLLCLSCFFISITKGQCNLIAVPQDCIDNLSCHWIDNSLTAQPLATTCSGGIANPSTPRCVDINTCEADCSLCDTTNNPPNNDCVTIGGGDAGACAIAGAGPNAGNCVGNICEHDCASCITQSAVGCLAQTICEASNALPVGCVYTPPGTTAEACEPADTMEPTTATPTTATPTTATPTTATPTTATPTIAATGVTSTGEPCICPTIICPPGISSDSGSSSGEAEAEASSDSDSGYPCYFSGSSSSSEELIMTTEDGQSNSTNSSTCICPTYDILYSDSGSDSDSSSSSETQIAAAIKGNGIEDGGIADFLGDGDVGVEDEEKIEKAQDVDDEVLVISLSDTAMANLWGMICVLLVINALFCICCKRKNKHKADMEQDNVSNLDVMP